MKPVHGSINQTWQDVLDQQLIRRLTRPLVLPGIIGTQLVQTVLSRARYMADRLPLLADLTQRRGSVEHQGGQVPVVYAQRWRNDIDETGAVEMLKDLQTPQAAERPVVQAMAVHPTDSIVDQTIGRTRGQESSLRRQDVVSPVSHATVADNTPRPDRFILPSGRSLRQMPRAAPSTGRGLGMNVQRAVSGDSAVAQTGGAVQRTRGHAKKVPGDHGISPASGLQGVAAASPPTGLSMPMVQLAEASDNWLQRKLNPLTMTLAVGDVIPTLAHSTGIEDTFESKQEARPASMPSAMSNAPSFPPPLASDAPPPVLPRISKQGVPARDESTTSIAALPDLHLGLAVPIVAPHSGVLGFPSQLPAALNPRSSGTTPVIQRSISNQGVAETTRTSWQGDGYGSPPPLVLPSPAVGSGNGPATFVQRTAVINRATESVTDQPMTSSLSGAVPSIGGQPAAGAGMESTSAGRSNTEADMDDLVDKALRKLMRRLAVEGERRGWTRWP